MHMNIEFNAICFYKWKVNIWVKHVYVNFALNILSEKLVFVEIVDDCKVRSIGTSSASLEPGHAREDDVTVDG